jgi:hypothetical protein
VEDSYQHDNEPSRSITCSEVLEYRLLKKGSAPWSQLVMYDGSEPLSTKLFMALVLLWRDNVALCFFRVELLRSRINRIVKQFEETGNVSDKRAKGRKRTAYVLKIGVGEPLEAVIRSARSVPSVAQQIGVTTSIAERKSVVITCCCTKCSWVSRCRRME